MSYFDENEANREPQEENSPHSVERDDLSPRSAGESSAGEPDPSRVDAEEKAGGSIKYSPDDHYAPHVSSYHENNSRATLKQEKQGMRARRIRNGAIAGLLAMALLCAALFGGVIIGRMSAEFPDSTTTPSIDGDPNNRPSVDRGQLVINVVERESAPTNGSIASVVAQVRDTVVEIKTESTVNSPYGNSVVAGAGSGVIISENGIILTCSHVVEGAAHISVVLTDGSTYVAEMLGFDTWSDLALLKIEATGLPYAVPARAAEGKDAYSYMTVGETVIAIGNPLGELGGSVTSGIISALGRSITVNSIPMTLMQFDASVNSGNSGGGLFNMNGDLIGIVNAKSIGETVEGIGFAIPTSDALPRMAELYQYGYVLGRPYLGLSFSNGLTIYHYEFNNELTNGEIRAADVLYSVDGQKLSSLSELTYILAHKSVGDTITVEIVRYSRYGGYDILTFDLKIHEYAPVTQG